jgi:hypothetical protein
MTFMHDLTYFHAEYAKSDNLEMRRFLRDVPIWDLS